MRTFSARTSRALTILELLMALAITLAFLGGSILAFVQIMRATDQAEARLEAFASVRHALDTISLELRSARSGPADASPKDLFYGLTQSLGYGNGVDDDKDGRIDEEILDGLDNDHDWVQVDDHHAQLSPPPAYYERPAYIGKADLGDSHVDEDLQVSSATLVFRSFPNELGVTPSMRQVSFYVGTYDQQPNVLIQEVTAIDAATSSPSTTVGPLAFNVVSFGALYWGVDQLTTSTTTQNPYWKTRWDASKRDSKDPELPASVYLTLTVRAASKPGAEPTGQSPEDLVTLQTMVNIESVLSDPRYKPASQSTSGQQQSAAPVLRAARTAGTLRTARTAVRR